MCENSPGENILIPSQCFMICVLIDGTINLLWKTKFHKRPGCDKNEMENLNNIMLPCQLRRLYRGTRKRLKKSNEFCVEKVSIK